jgi:hypothetical protein
MARLGGAYPPMKVETRRRLGEGYRDDASALAAFLDVDLGHWSVFRGQSQGSGSGSPAPASAPELSAPGPG